MLAHVQTDVLAHLTGVFGLAALRAEQTEAIEASLAGRDALVVLPTGYGKSLCYQLPAVTLARRGAGPTLVVSPLIALMDDQVSALSQRGVRAAAATRASLAPQARGARLPADARAYLREPGAARERITAPAARLRRALAVAEAHCISEWATTFARNTHGSAGSSGSCASR